MKLQSVRRDIRSRRWLLCDIILELYFCTTGGWRSGVLNGLQGHPRSILAPIESRKRVCEFLLVINSNLGAVLPRFRDIAGFLLRGVTPSGVARLWSQGGHRRSGGRKTQHGRGSGESGYVATRDYATGDPTPIPSEFLGCSLGLDCWCCGS